MARVNVFADESGNFDFSRTSGASKYFILTTITCDDCEIGNALLQLRREMAWDGLGLDSECHATTDKQAVRDRVFDLIRAHDFRVDATIFEKSKAEPKIRPSDERFYQYAWYLHMKYVALKIAGRRDELFVVSASLGTKKKRLAMYEGVRDVITQTAPTAAFRVASWQAHSDPCLQIADYCCWAIFRKWEGGDTRSYDLIRGKVQTEFEIFRNGRTHHY